MGKVKPGDRGELVGLRSSDLNGRRVVVEAQVAGKDGDPRFGEQPYSGRQGGRLTEEKVVEVLVDGRLERFKVKAKNLRLDPRAEPEEVKEPEVEEISAPVPAQARASSSDAFSARLAGLGVSDETLEFIADTQRVARPSTQALVADMQRLASSRPPRGPGAGTADAHGNAPPWIFEALGRPEPRGQVRVDKSGSVALPREVTHGVDGEDFPQLGGPLAAAGGLFDGASFVRYFQTGSDGSITAVFVVPMLNMPLSSIDFQV